jgi:hypothetical protein
MELEYVFDNFSKYNMKILLGHFNEKVWGEDSSKTKKIGMIVYIKLVMIMRL